MAEYYRCVDCGNVFKTEDASCVTDCVGEFWGVPAYEKWHACPSCMSTDLEEYEPKKYWVSLYLQDGTQTGATLTINGANDNYDELEYECKRRFGDVFGGIADYGAYDDEEDYKNVIKES